MLELSCHTEEVIRKFTADKSRGTAVNYGYIIRNIAQDLGKDYDKITPADLRFYYLTILEQRMQDPEQPLSSAAVRQIFYVMKRFYSFYNHCEEPEEMADLTVTEWQVPRSEDFLTVPEFDQVTAFIEKGDRFPESIRFGLNLACALAFYAGLTRAEILTLRRSSFSRMNGQVVMKVIKKRGKSTAKERLIELPREILGFYEEQEPFMDEETIIGYTYGSRSGKGHKGKRPVSGDALTWYFREITAGLVCSVGKHITLQTLRSSCIYACLGEDCDYRELSDFFGLSTASLRVMYCVAYGREKE